jgi:glycosyltransferase involved in cell wall biosynthesis
MNTMPKVSVLIPAYNAERYLVESVESILNQSFQDFEIIILDDGSKDKTWEVMQSLVARDPRIVIKKHEKNMGISQSRNDLVGWAAAPYIAWQDADDISYKERLALQYAFMETHKDVGICGAYLNFYNEKGSLGVRKYALDDDTLRRRIFKYSPVSQGVAMLRKESMEGLPLYDIRWPGAEDLNMSFKIGCNWKFGNIPQVLLDYRIYEESTTFKKLRRLEMNTLRLRWKYAHHPAYRFGITDIVYNLLQVVTLFLMPPALRIALFNRFRNTAPVERVVPANVS